MALEVTPGTGATIGTSERAGEHFQQVVDVGGENWDSGRVNVTSSGGSAISARAGRREVGLYALPTNTQIIDVGPSGAAAGSDFPLSPGMAVVLPLAGAIHADTVSGTQVLAYYEIWDENA